LLSNAVHFGSDFAGSLAVLIGLVAVSAGWPAGDSVAALFVAALVLSAALRLMRRNVDVLMDRAPADAEEAAQRAIERLEPAVTLRRLRMRSAAGRHFADVVIAVAPDAAVGQGHAAADAVEDAVQQALPETDVVVHVEPAEKDARTRELAHAAAMRVPRVREIHNISILHVAGRTEVSLHLKLPGELSLDEAHAVASEVEHAIEEALPGVDTVRTHLEPLAEEAEGRAPLRVEIAHDAQAVTRIVRERTGAPPRELRFLQTEDGLLVFLTLGLDPTVPLAEAHTRASEIEERIRTELPAISEIIVHTEP
jgi:divalent metal cation (Fe/Co/Zn/Cd) transporter